MICEGVRGVFAAFTHPAESQEEVHPTGSLHAVPQFPIHQVLPGEYQEAEAHGHQQHVEDSSHVVNIQFTAHHLNFVIMTDTGQPEALQHLNFIWKGDEGGARMSKRSRRKKTDKG